MRPLTAEREVQRGARLPAGAGHKRVARARSGRARRGKTRRVARAAEVAPARRRRGAVTGRSTLVSPLVYLMLIDAFASAVSARNPGDVARSRRPSLVAAGRARSAGSYTLYRDNGPVYPLSYRTDRSAARHKVTHDAAVPRHAAAPPRRRARKLITIKNCFG